MRICEFKDGVLTMRMPKEVDHHAAEMMRSEANHMIDAYHVRRLVFDFSETEFMDSSGIGVVIGRARMIGYRGGEAVAVGMSERVSQIFHISGLDALVRAESDAVWKGECRNADCE